MEDMKPRQSPITLTAVVAHQWHCDHFGHLNARHYASAVDDALFIFWARAGVKAPQKGSEGTMPVSAELKLTYIAEVHAGAALDLSATILRVGNKSVTLLIEMRDIVTNELVATAEVAEVFFDAVLRRSAPIPDVVRDWLTASPA